MKKVLGIALAVVIVATLLNDVGVYLRAWYDLDVIAQETARVASSTMVRERDKVATTAADFARTQGATVYMYDQNDKEIHVWVEVPVPGTWVLGYATALYYGQPLDTPYKLRTDTTAQWH